MEIEQGYSAADETGTMSLNLEILNHILWVDIYNFTLHQLLLINSI